MAERPTPASRRPLQYATPAPRAGEGRRIAITVVALTAFLGVVIIVWALWQRARFSASGTVTVRLQNAPPQAWRRAQPQQDLSVLPSLSGADRTRRAHCADNLRQIASALQSYANKNDWRYPDRLEELVEAGLLPAGALDCPADEGGPEGLSSYVYTGKGLRFPLDPDTVLLHERSAGSHAERPDGAAGEGGVHVLFADGRAKFLPASEAGPLFAAANRPGPLTLPATRPHTDVTASSGSPGSQQVDSR